MKLPFLIGRIIFGGYFLYNGVNHFLQRKQLAQYAGSKQVPAPEAGVLLSGVLLLAGGGSVLLGLKPKPGTAALIAFLTAVTPVMHKFWSAPDPNQRMNDMIHFSKNLALLGAALALMGVKEPWPASVPAQSAGTSGRVLQFARNFAA